MAGGKIGDLPKLGDIQLPVHLMHYDDREDKKKYFHSGFAFWKAADGASDVSTDSHDLGSIGATMGGHVEMNRYYGKDIGGEYKQWIEVIIDVRDIWGQIEELLESKEVKVQLNGLEELYAKYKSQQESEDEGLKENEKKEKEEKLKQLASALKNKKPEIETSGQVHKIKDTEILDDGNWNLIESMKGSDYEFYEYIESHKDKKFIPNRDKDGKIPVTIGGNVVLSDSKFGEKRVLYTDPILPEDYNRKVSLEITSFVGISPEAIHYYGKLKFNMPYLKIKGNPNYSTTSFDIPLFDNGQIEITRILEKWEFKKFPSSYEYYDVGDRYKGFYTPEDAIEAGRKVFEDLFSNDWVLKIEKYY